MLRGCLFTQRWDVEKHQSHHFPRLRVIADAFSSYAKQGRHNRETNLLRIKTFSGSIYQLHFFSFPFFLQPHSKVIQVLCASFYFPINFLSHLFFLSFIFFPSLHVTFRSTFIKKNIICHKCFAFHTNISML